MLSTYIFDWHDGTLHVNTILLLLLVVAVSGGLLVLLATWWDQHQ